LSCEEPEETEAAGVEGGVEVVTGLGGASGLTVFGSTFFCCALCDGSAPEPDLVDVDVVGAPPDLVEVDVEVDGLDEGVLGDLPPFLEASEEEKDLELEDPPVGVDLLVEVPLPDDVGPVLGDFPALLGEVDLDGFLF